VKVQKMALSTAGLNSASCLNLRDFRFHPSAVRGSRTMSSAVSQSLLETSRIFEIIRLIEDVFRDQFSYVTERACKTKKKTIVSHR
jgi:hypothetical protein